MILINSLLAIAFSLNVYAQVPNPNIVGTWASGSKNVQTGPGFANPANKSFTYPKTAGISYSFSQDGFYEIARYRFNGNGSEPNCITGVMNWVHGHYDLNPNGSIILTPLGDGYQQIQDPCAAVSNFIEDYNQTELIQHWAIFQDQTQGLKLHLFQFDGAPLAPQFQVSTTPQMLPTQLLRNVTPPADAGNGVKPQSALVNTNSASSLMDLSSLVVGGLITSTSLFTLAFSSLVL